MMSRIPRGGYSTAATPLVSIRRHSSLFRFHWKWLIYINAMDNAEEIVSWCFDNFDKVDIDAKKNDVWLSVTHIDASVFYYDKQVVTTLPFRIQIWIRDDEDATGFKLRWM